MLDSLLSAFGDLKQFHVLNIVLYVAILIIPLSIWKLSHRKHKVLPGPWSWPVFGHIKTLTCNPHTTLDYFHQVYGDIYQLTVGQQTVVVIGNLEGIQEGLTDKEQTLSGRPDFQDFKLIYDKEEGRQRGICTADNNEKTCIRRTFLSASVDAYCSDVSHIEEKLSSEIIDTVNRLIDSAECVDPFLIMKPACFNSVYRLVYDQRLDPQGNLMKETIATTDSRSQVLQFNSVDFCPFLKIFRTDDHANYVQNRTGVQLEYHHRYVNLHKDTYDPAQIRDMTDHLLLYVENGEDFGLLDKNDIDYLLLDAVTFGYQGISVTLTWLLGYMASDLEIQRKIQDELDNVIGRDRLPSLEDQPYLPLTTAAILETLRLASVHPFLLPHAVTEHTILKEFHIPKGSIVLFNVWKIHHDPKYWKNPNVYNPLRFLNSENNLEIPDCFLPYGSGARQCPGEGLTDVTLFLFYATIMHQLTLTPGEGFPLTSEYDYLIRPKSFTVKIKKRD